jgi:hypothetical protein
MHTHSALVQSTCAVCTCTPLHHVPSTPLHHTGPPPNPETAQFLAQAGLPAAPPHPTEGWLGATKPGLASLYMVPVFANIVLGVFLRVVAWMLIKVCMGAHTTGYNVRAGTCLYRYAFFGS